MLMVRGILEISSCCFDRLRARRFSLGDLRARNHCRQTGRASERREFRLGILGFARGYLGIPCETKDGNEADSQSESRASPERRELWLQ